MPVTQNREAPISASIAENEEWNVSGDAYVNFVSWCQECRISVKCFALFFFMCTAALRANLLGWLAFIIVKVYLQNEIQIFISSF